MKGLLIMSIKHPDMTFPWLRTIALLAMVLAVGCATLLLPKSLFRAGAAVISIFVLPGVFLLRALWPDAKCPSMLWRLAMVVPTSVAIVGVVLLMVNYLATYSYEAVIGLVTILDLGLVVVGSLWRK
jgi:uncharacterized membrane protein